MLAMSQMKHLFPDAEFRSKRWLCCPNPLSLLACDIEKINFMSNYRIQRCHRRMGGRDRPGSPCAGHFELQAVLRRVRPRSAPSRTAKSPSSMRDARDAARSQCRMRPAAVRTGMAIEAEIKRWSRFDRKNYFYADLPQGYQISQLYHPIVGEGQLLIEADEKAGIEADKIIGIERIHIEQDAGKLMHDQHPTMS